MNGKTFGVAIFFLVIIGLIGAADVGLNLFSLIPGVGPAFETLTEVSAELLQLIVTALGLFLVANMEDD